MTAPVRVQPLVRLKAAAMGPPGQRWLESLPDLLDEVEQRWSIRVGRRLPGGSSSYVAHATAADGARAVLKLGLPDPDIDLAREVRTLERAAGRGYVRLLRADIERRAMLLEALGPSLDRGGHPPQTQLAILADTLRSAWLAPEPGERTQAAAEAKAAGLGAYVASAWERLGRPCSEAVVEEALRCAERRRLAADPERAVIVHGDPHPANALRVPAAGSAARSTAGAADGTAVRPTPATDPVAPGRETGFVLVDPDGFLADPAYDLGVALRDWCTPLLAGDAPALARRYCRLLADRSGLDEAAVWDWGLLERVSTGLFVLSFGAERVGRPFLTSAERLLCAP